MRRRRMSKQMPFEDWAPPEWLGLAKGLYAGMLRKAAIIENLKDTPPRCPMTLPHGSNVTCTCMPVALLPVTLLPVADILGNSTTI